MIKYFKEILVTIKPAQRLLALILLLITIIVITLGVQYFKERNSRDTQCEERSKKKDKQIQELYLSQDSLQNLILVTKTEFNGKLIQTNEFYSKKIDSLIVYLRQRKQLTQMVIVKKDPPVYHDEMTMPNDDGVVVSCDVVEPKKDTVKVFQKVTVANNFSDTYLINSLLDLKKVIQTNTPN